MTTVLSMSMICCSFSQPSVPNVRAMQQEEQEEKQLLGKKAAVLNPLCGYGSVLAVANAYGLDAYGMDISLKCCRIAAAHSASARPVPRVMRV